MKYEDNPGGREAQVLTLRADKPFPLSGGWKLSTRIDLPFSYSDAPSADNPTSERKFGYSDTLVQALFVTPLHGHWAFAFGTQVVFPTASQDQFGTGNYQLVPTFAAIYQLPQIRRGSFAGVVMRSQFSFAGDDNRRDINDLLVQPMLNVTLPDRWFMTFAPEMRIDLKGDGDVFLPFDMTLGRKLSKDVIMSLSVDIPIINDYRQDHWQAEFRVGFFF